jgi:signal transduction histidine kinase
MSQLAPPTRSSQGTRPSPGTRLSQRSPKPALPKGRRLDPFEAFEVTPWRALIVFRFTTLAYAIVLTAHNNWRYPHRISAWVVIAAMVAWSVLASLGYERARLRAWPLLLVDLAVTAACVLATLPIVGEQLMAVGVPTLTITWMACPVLAVAVVKGMRWGVVAALLIGACDLAVRGVITQATFTGTAIMAMAAIALGYLGNIATRAQEQLRQAAAVEAAHAERERLARGIHDSVLQVLALVQRRGEELGGEAAELGQLAGEQERALRALVNAPARRPPTGLVDLREVVAPLASARVTISAPATPVWLPAAVVSELAAAAGAAAENVRQHCPASTRAWILLEDEGSAVTLTLRDDGPGFPSGRLEQAAAQGRLGVAQSIQGRLADLGGVATIASTPGQGTEVELRVPRPR